MAPTARFQRVPYRSASHPGRKVLESNQRTALTVTSV
jgi:hypothetical protein